LNGMAVVYWLQPVEKGHPARFSGDSYSAVGPGHACAAPLKGGRRLVSVKLESFSTGWGIIRR
jgi:hypothetical protein